MTEPDPLRARLSSRPPLRDRLLALRRCALSRLAVADKLDGGTLELVADAGDALAALEAETMQAAAPIPGDRALVVDDNMRIQIMVYSADRQAAAAMLTPTAAIRLGNQLIAAGVRRL